jgi:hypothetical protein
VEAGRRYVVAPWLKTRMWLFPGKRLLAGHGPCASSQTNPHHFSRTRVSAIRDQRETHRLPFRPVGPGSAPRFRGAPAGKNVCGEGVVSVWDAKTGAPLASVKTNPILPSSPGDCEAGIRGTSTRLPTGGRGPPDRGDAATVG